MTQITVTREDQDDRQFRYVARIDGTEGEAELVMTRRGPATFSADHTFAPQQLRGTGAASALVQAMIDDARDRGFKVIPRCSYVVDKAGKHPEWADVFVKA